MQNATFSKLHYYLLTLLVCCLWTGSSWAEPVGAADDENQPPVITITNLQPYYLTGQEYVFTIEASDPDGDALTLMLEEGVNEEIVQFSPGLPLSGNGTLSTQVRVYAQEGSSIIPLFLRTTDAQGASSTEVVELLITDPTRFYPPADTVRIGVNQPFLIRIKVQESGDTHGMYTDALPFGKSSEGIEIWAGEGEEEAWPTEAHIGTHVLKLYALHDTGYIATDTVVVVVDPSCTNQALYQDADGDGWGSGSRGPGVYDQLVCSSLTGYVANELDCDDMDAEVYPGAGACAGPENEAPTLTLSGDAGLEQYEVGQEYIILIEVDDPEGDEVTLDLLVNQWEPDPERGKIPLSATDFSPEFPITQTAPYTVEVRFTPQDNHSRYNQLEFSATDAAGNKTETVAFIHIWQEPGFDVPDSPIHVDADEGQRIDIILSNHTYGDLVEMESPTLPLISDYGYGVVTITDQEGNGVGREFIGTHEITLRLTRDTFVQQATITLIVEADCAMQNWYKDLDGDGWGNSSIFITSCSSVDGHVTNKLDCDDWNVGIYPGIGNCPAVENQAPTLTLSGDAGLEQYEVGQEYTILVEVTDPENDLVTLDLQVEQIYPDEDKIGHTKEDFHPGLPLTRQAPFTVELRFTSTEEYIRDNVLRLTATDETGSQDTETAYVTFFHPYRFVIPSEPVHVSVGKEFSIYIPIENENDVYTAHVEAPTAPFDLLLDHDHGGFILLQTPGPETLTEEHIGSHDLQLTLRDGDYVHQATLTLVVEAACDLQNWYLDRDKDGYGLPHSVPTTSCTPVVGRVANSQDCDDTNPAIHPEAEELPGDDLDNNCNGEVDEGEEPATCWSEHPLKLWAECSEIASQRLWKISNPNSCAVEVKWEVHKTSHQGSAIAPPGESFFSTPAGDKKNQVVFLHWQDSQGKWKKKGMASAAAHCDKQVKDKAKGKGKSKNSRTAEAAHNLTEGISLYPVPFGNQLSVEHPSIRAAAPIKVALITMDGRTLNVSAQIVEQREGYLQLNLQGLRLSNGLYILRLDVAGETPAFKRVVRQE